ncbi:MAG TPA: diacylglycerol kinase family protein [Acidimicrobiales bacterium]|nr:diacylglycerol kinase family protein [Acidimicrobiales bacterium]
MNILLIVNAVASGVTPRNRSLVEEALRASHDVDVVVTTARQHACALAGDAAAAGVDAVVALGGDGTVNEVANGLIDSDTALGVLPGGSTNVFARTLGFSNRPGTAVRLLVDALAAGSKRRIGVGQADSRSFVFHVGVGFDAAVVQQVEQRGDLKRWLGHGLFAYGAVATWLRHYDRSRPRFRVHLPDGEVIGDGYFAVFEESDPYTFFGPRPFRLVPGTGFDTGLSAVVLRDLSAATLLGATLAALTGGRRLSGMGCVAVRPGLDSVRVEGLGPFPWQVDGDFLGDIDSLEITHRPNCLDVLVPVAAGTGR